MASPAAHTQRLPALAHAMVASIVLFAAFHAARAQALSPSSMWTLTNVNVVDVETGRILPNQAISIRAGRTAAITPMTRFDAGRGGTPVDGRNAYVVPGLYDMHVQLGSAGHVFDSTIARIVASGVVGLRDLGFPVDSLSALAALRRRVGATATPRVWYVGPILNAPSTTNFPQHVQVDGPEAVNAVVSRIAAGGGMAVKIHDRLALEVYRQVAAAARRKKLSIVGHLPALVPVDVAIASGQRTVEHLGGLTHGLLMACSRDSTARARIGAAIVRNDFFRLYKLSMSGDHLMPLIDGFDSRQCENVAARLKQASVWQVPNLVLWKAWATDTSEHPTAQDLAARRRLYATMLELTRILHRGGVAIMAGTDDIEPVQAELTELVAAGLSPLDALRSATRAPARFLGVADSIGLVKSAFVADLTILEGNPIADINNTRKVLAVVLGGRLHAVSPAWKQ